MTDSKGKNTWQNDEYYQNNEHIELKVNLNE